MIPILRKMNLINVHFWTYLLKERINLDNNNYNNSRIGTHLEIKILVRCLVGGLFEISDGHPR